MSDKQFFLEFFETYFAQQAGFNGDHLLDYWHPNGIMHIVGNAGEFRTTTIEDQIKGMQAARERMPDLKVDFVIDEIEQIAIHDDLIASIHVRYRMVFPEGYGQHRTFFNLANINGKWGVVHALDRGVEVLPE